MESGLILIVSFAGFFWPMLVSCLYLVFRWRAISGKASFWFVSSLVGYVLFIGVPFLLRVFVVSYFGSEKAVLQELKNPDYRWFVDYYWSIIAIVMLTIALLPIFSTHYIYKKRLENG